MELFATAARGTEVVLRDELRAIGVADVRADRGGVHFRGDLADAARVCLWSAIAVRVMVAVGDGPAHDADALYATARAVDWRPWISARQTLSVSAVSQIEGLDHTVFVAQRIKDAIVDQLRDAGGQRPDVDRRDADVKVFAVLGDGRARLFLDAAGEPLHRRGYRDVQGEAPLKETLAAACLALAGYRGDLPFIDPMCGSGTLAIEAARKAHNIAPGILHPGLGLLRWAAADEGLRAAVEEQRKEARAARRDDAPPIFAGDLDPGVLALAERNAERAGVRISLHCDRLGHVQRPSSRGVMVSNAPYGERLMVDDGFVPELAVALEALGSSWVRAVLTDDHTLPQALHRSPHGSHALRNGAIDCRLFVFGEAPSKPR